MNVKHYKQNKVREIIEDAITQLVALGATPDTAAALLVHQGIVRIEDTQKRKDAAKFVVEAAEDRE